MGFSRTNLRRMKLPTGMSGGEKLFTEFLERMDRYDETRNFPSIKGPSYLSTHLRFGTVSIRGWPQPRGSAGKKARAAQKCGSPS